MRRLILLLSGPICSGKTFVAKALHARFGFPILSTRELVLRKFPHILPERRAMQAFAEQKEAETGGSWIAELVVCAAAELPVAASFVVDAVRTRDQILKVREHLGDGVFHCHVVAGDATLAQRLQSRTQVAFSDPDPYTAITAVRMERIDVPGLKRIADLVCDSSNDSLGKLFAVVNNKIA